MIASIPQDHGARLKSRFPATHPAWSRAHAEAGHLASTLRSAVAEPGPLSEAASHHFRQVGKMTRGRLALAVGSAVGAPPAQSFHVATACELLHNASLIHDDVQDGDEMRRGQTSVWHEFGVDVAINLGDYLLVRAIQFANECGDPAIVTDFTHATMRVIRGQSHEMREKATVSDLARYEEIAKEKTGPLLALPAVAAGRLGDLPQSYLDTVRRALEEVGVAYQLQDDIADLFDLKGRSGPGQDLREGKRTGPILFLDPRTDAALCSDDDPDYAARAKRIATSAATARTQQRIDELIEASRSRVASLPSALAQVMFEAFDFLTQAARGIDATASGDGAHGQRARTNAG